MLNKLVCWILGHIYVQVHRGWRETLSGELRPINKPYCVRCRRYKTEIPANPRCKEANQ